MKKLGRPKDKTPKEKFHPTLILPIDHPLIPFLRKAKRDERLAASIIEALMSGGIVTAVENDEDDVLDVSSMLV